MGFQFLHWKKERKQKIIFQLVSHSSLSHHESKWLTYSIGELVNCYLIEEFWIRYWDSLCFVFRLGGGNFTVYNYYYDSWREGGGMNRVMQIRQSVPFFRQFRRSAKIFVQILKHNHNRKLRCKGSKVNWNMWMSLLISPKCKEGNPAWWL